MRALAIAASGMNAQQRNLDVIANNVANVNSTGFKRGRAEFVDLLYQVERAGGVPSAANSQIRPEGVNVGLGVKTAAIRTVHLQGTLENTGNMLDLALVGNGWFQIQNPAGETLYTRSGAFNTNADGELVTTDGFLVDPGITVPQGTLGIEVNRTGQVFAIIAGQLEAQEIGQLTLANFANQAGLRPLGDSRFEATEASGDPIVGIPGDEDFARIEQGYLEGSNADPVKELTALISAQRAYELNSKVIQAADQMAGVVSNGIR
ncbi:MAG: flagellar basal-body rod protein FlgG [Pseudomonadota bacterium]